MEVVEGNLLVNAKQALRNTFEVGRALDLRGCICCSPTSRTDTVFYSAAGERECNRTGLCEFCFDAAFGGDNEEENRIHEHMTMDGRNLMELWVMLSKARGRAIVTHNTFRLLVQMACGQIPQIRIYQVRPS